MPQKHAGLRDLLDKALVKHDVKTINALATRAKELGYPTTQTTLWGIYNGKYRSDPKRTTLEVIAGLAGVSLEEAYRAAEMEPPGLPFEPAPGADKLTPKQRDVVNSVIRALLDAQSGHRLGTASDRGNMNTNRVTPKEGSDQAWADEEGIFGPSRGDDSAKEM